MSGFGRRLEWIHRGAAAAVLLLASFVVNAVTFGDAGIAIPPIYTSMAPASA